MKKEIINTVPHCGTHLVGSVLNLVGFKHASRFDWRSFKNKKISINWRTSEKDTLLNTKLDKNAFYEFKPVYKNYDFIIPSKDLNKTIRKMKFFLKK